MKSQSSSLFLNCEKKPEPNQQANEDYPTRTRKELNCECPSSFSLPSLSTSSCFCSLKSNQKKEQPLICSFTTLSCEAPFSLHTQRNYFLEAQRTAKACSLAYSIWNKTYKLGQNRMQMINHSYTGCYWTNSLDVNFCKNVHHCTFLVHSM